MTEEKTYKAVFTCPALGERIVWYVSSRNEANAHLKAHIKTVGNKTLAKYKHNEWTMKVSQIFGDDYDVHYDAVNSWGR